MRTAAEIERQRVIDLTAQMRREESGEQCIKCGSTDPEYLTTEFPCGIPTFKCLACRAAWFDTREREPSNPDWQYDDEDAA